METYLKNFNKIMGLFLLNQNKDSLALKAIL